MVGARTVLVAAMTSTALSSIGAASYCPADGINKTHMNSVWDAATVSGVPTLGPRLPALAPRPYRTHGAVGSCAGGATGGFDGGEIVVAATLGPQTSSYGKIMRFTIEIFLDWLNLERPLTVNGTNVVGGLMVGGRRYAVRYAWVGEETAADAATGIAHAIRRENAHFAWGGYGSTVSRLQAEQAELDGVLIMASIAADVSVFRGKNLTFGTLPPAENYIKNAVRAVAQAVVDLGENFTTVLKVGMLFTPPLDAMCDPIGQLALDLNMSASGFDPAVATPNAQAWIHNSLPKHPTESEVDSVLRALRDDGVNFIVGCTYVSSGLATIEGLERLDYSPLAAAFTSTVDISAYQQRVRERGWWQGEYQLGVSPWHPSLQTRGEFSGMTSADYMERYLIRYNEIPSYHGPASFSAACALFAAIEAAGSLDPWEVQASLRVMKLQELGFAVPMDFEGPQGRNQGQNNPDMLVLQTQAHFSAVHTELNIVYPLGSAAANLKFPTPRWGKRRCAALGSGVLYSPYDPTKSQVELLMTAGECSGNGVCKFARHENSREVFECVCQDGYVGRNCERAEETRTIVIGALFQVADAARKEQLELQAARIALQNVNAMTGFFSIKTQMRLLVVDLLPLRTAATGALKSDAAETAAQALLEAGAVATVGSRYSSDSMSLAGPLHERGIALLSHSATNGQLSNREFYPSFARTCPPDTRQGVALADVVSSLGWTHVYVIHCDDAYCAGLKDDFLRHAAGADGVQVDNILSVTLTSTKHLTQAALELAIEDLNQRYKDHCNSEVVIVVLLHTEAACDVLNSELSSLPVAWLTSESLGSKSGLFGRFFGNKTLGFLSLNLAVERLPDTHPERPLLPANASVYELTAHDAVRALAEAFAYLQRTVAGDNATSVDVLAALETITFLGQSGPVDIVFGDRALGYNLLYYTQGLTHDALSNHQVDDATTVVGTWSVKDGAGSLALVSQNPVTRASLPHQKECPSATLDVEGKFSTSSSSRQHECFLKGNFTQSPCGDGSAPGHYVTWTYGDLESCGEWRGVSGPKICSALGGDGTATCLREGFDWTGKPGCGLPPIHAIIVNSLSNWQPPSWYQSVPAVVVKPDMIHPDQCQLLCQQNVECTHFSYEYERINMRTGAVVIPSITKTVTTFLDFPFDLLRSSLSFVTMDFLNLHDIEATRKWIYNQVVTQTGISSNAVFRIHASDTNGSFMSYSAADQYSYRAAGPGYSADLSWTPHVSCIISARDFVAVS